MFLEPKLTLYCDFFFDFSLLILILNNSLFFSQKFFKTFHFKYRKNCYLIFLILLILLSPPEIYSQFIIFIIFIIFFEYFIYIYILKNNYKN